MKIKNWKLRINGNSEYVNEKTEIQANVPGDITWDMYLAGIIEDPYFALNHKKIGWITELDYTYSSEFDAEEVSGSDEAILTFYSIDLFSEIYLNGILLGKTGNAFLRYDFDVKKYLKAKKNKLEVKMLSTVEAMKKIDCEGYFGVFNVPRLFLRKPQCHFGWDWAPALCGYGICGDVELNIESKYRIKDVCVRTFDSGYVTLLAELNYNVRSMVDSMGVAIDNTAAVKDGDKLIFSVERTPKSGEYESIEIDVTGKKNFANLKINNRKLWWPKGYGEQPLYGYKVELIRGEKVVSAKTGYFAFREVKLIEEPKSGTTLGYDIAVNGKKIFIKGSNWVPAECFSGTMTDEKCKKLIDLADNANINMLRVWGGGAYERDFFYDYCDRKGIMVWQDFMFACSDIPEDDKEWVANTLKECEYQIKRLRDHPSLVYWCGGNEKTGTYGLQISKGDFFIDNILTGLVKTLDPTRPFARQSPCSITDVGNDLTSGESHYNSFEATLATYPKTGRTAITDYRKLVSQKTVSFASECAIFGPNSEETNEKIYPKDKLWPLNEIWEDRMMDNPYAGIVMPFMKREQLYIRDMYGEAESLSDFTAKGMMIHAETLRCETEFARSNKDITGGIMNWMYTDIWPSGTWSIIDYYLEPKQAYYQIKRAFKPLLLTFVENKDGKTQLVVVNDTTDAFSGEIEYGKKDLEGNISEKEKIVVSVAEGGHFKTDVNFDVNGKNVYLYIKSGDYKNVYSPTFYRDCDFKADYEVETEKISDNELKVKIKARTFVKGLFLSFKDNYKYIYSDNYLDIEAGDEAVVTITSEDKIDKNGLKAASFDERVKR